MEENGYQTQREYANAFIQTNLDEIIRTMLSGEISADKWARKAKVNGAKFNAVLKECGFSYGSGGWTYQRGIGESLPTPEVEELELDQDEQSEIAELINRQDRVLKSLIEEVKILRARDEAKSARLQDLEQQVESLTNERNTLSFQLAKWKAEKRQGKMREIQLAKQNGLGTLDEALLLLGK